MSTNTKLSCDALIKAEAAVDGKRRQIMMSEHSDNAYYRSGRRKADQDELKKLIERVEELS